MTTPRIDRPVIPDGYGVKEDGPYLTWNEVEQRLIDSLHYWLSTTHPDGGPHVVPRWGVWLDGAFWYDGSPRTRHVRNLKINSGCVLHLESGEAATIVYGPSVASDPVHGDLGVRLAEEFGRKYAPGYAPGPDSWSDGIAGGLRALRPEKAMAWSRFPLDLTRFTFTGERT